MDENKKPPLGAKPHWLIYPKRIQELTMAILRYSLNIEETPEVTHIKEYEQIALWGQEIAMLAEFESKACESVVYEVGVGGRQRIDIGRLGRWEENYGGQGISHCDVCKTDVRKHGQEFTYCPNCGAEMNLEEDNAEIH